MPHQNKHIPLRPGFEEAARHTAPHNPLRPIPYASDLPHFSAPFEGAFLQRSHQPAPEAGSFEELSERSQTWPTVPITEQERRQRDRSAISRPRVSTAGDQLEPRLTPEERLALRKRAAVPVHWLETPIERETRDE